MVGINLVNGIINGGYLGFRSKGVTTKGGRLPRNGYHLVDPSPWPIIVSAGAMNEAASFIRFVHNGSYTLVNFVCAT